MKRSNEMFKFLVHLTEIAGHFLGERGGLDALLARRLGHLEAMLVGAGQEEDVAARIALEARDRVGGDRLIGVADMRAAVGVGDRGGDVEGLGHRPGV